MAPARPAAWAGAQLDVAGICARNSGPVTFGGWVRYRVPPTPCQLAVTALYVLALFHLAR